MRPKASERGKKVKIRAKNKEEEKQQEEKKMK